MSAIDQTDYYQALTLRLLDDCERICADKPARTSDEIKREVRAEFLAAGRSVPV